MPLSKSGSARRGSTTSNYFLDGLQMDLGRVFVLGTDSKRRGLEQTGQPVDLAFRGTDSFRFSFTVGCELATRDPELSGRTLRACGLPYGEYALEALDRDSTMPQVQRGSDGTVSVSLPSVKNRLSRSARSAGDVRHIRRLQQHGAQSFLGHYGTR